MKKIDLSSPSIPMSNPSASSGGRINFAFPLLNPTYGIDIKFPGRPKQTLGSPLGIDSSVPNALHPKCLMADYLHTSSQWSFSTTACNYQGKPDSTKLFSDLTKVQYQGKSLDINRDIKKGPYLGHEWRAYFPKSKVVIHTQLFIKGTRSIEVSVWVPASGPIPTPEPETLKFFETLNLNTYP